MKENSDIKPTRPQRRSLVAMAEEGNACRAGDKAGEPGSPMQPASWRSPVSFLLSRGGSDAGQVCARGRRAATTT